MWFVSLSVPSVLPPYLSRLLCGQVQVCLYVEYVLIRVMCCTLQDDLSDDDNTAAATGGVAIQA